MKILLAMDASPASQIALEQVAARPWPAGTSWEVLSAVEPSHLWTTSEVAETAIRSATEVVEEAAARLRELGWNASGTTTRGTDPKAAILAHAKDIGADFIVLGSHGTSAVMSFLMGSVASTVLRYAPCSVEIVRARRDGSTAAARSPRILLATDGSESANKAARSIAARPWPAGTQVRVLSAVELMLGPVRAFLEPPVFDNEFMESARASAMQHAQEAIASARKILAGTSLDVSESVSVLLDTPKTMILQEATEWQADLIVLGSHGRRGIDLFLLGSVSDAVALHADCSVEIIRQQGVR